MSAVYDAVKIKQLIVEAREDDARMTPAPWHGDEISGIVFGDDNHEDGSIEVFTCGGEARIEDAEAIARSRNNLRALTDQLEAAHEQFEAARKGLTALAAQVDQTDPQCPIGTALTRAGLTCSPGPDPRLQPGSQVAMDTQRERK